MLTLIQFEVKQQRAPWKTDFLKRVLGQLPPVNSYNRPLTNFFIQKLFSFENFASSVSCLTAQNHY